MPELSPEKELPKLHLAPFLGPQGELTAEAMSKLAAELIARLRTAPYWLVFVTEQNPIEVNLLVDVLVAMSQIGQTANWEPPRISSTRVRVNPQEAGSDHLTRYSRTADALPLHTDSSNKLVPQNLVTFAMEQPDPRGGGESVMLSAVDLVSDMPAGLVHLLRQPAFPFVGNKRFPILQGKGDELLIRYYRNQIETTLAKGQTLHQTLAAALNELDRYLDFCRHSVRFHMQAGDVVMMDNQRVLHGRRAMPVNSPRLMHRFRLSIPALEADR